MEPTLNDRTFRALELAQPELARLGVTMLPRAGDDDPLLFDISDADELAGLIVAHLCMATLGEAQIVPGTLFGTPWRYVVVNTADVINACFRSQIAAFPLSAPDYYGMLSGPGRTCLPRDPYASAFGSCDIGSKRVVVIIEGKRPTESAIAALAAQAARTPGEIVGLFGPTKAPASVIQILARVVETAVKRIYDLKAGFDVRCIRSASGRVPICPRPKNSDAAMAMSNEAAIYGGTVNLEVDADDELLERLAQLVPSSAAAHLYGKPFSEIMAAAKVAGGINFSLIEEVFAPAVIEFRNVRSGRVHIAGKIDEVQLRRAFYPAA